MIRFGTQSSALSSLVCGAWLTQPETAALDLNVPGLKHVLAEYKIEHESSARRNVLEQLYNSLKTCVQGRRENSKQPSTSNKKSKRAVDKWTSRKRCCVQKDNKKLPPLRTRTVWLAKKQAKKSKLDTSTNPPIRRSTRISAKAHAEANQALCSKAPAKAGKHIIDGNNPTIRHQQTSLHFKRPSSATATKVDQDATIKIYCNSSVARRAPNQRWESGNFEFAAFD
ncbi:hypothetical protein PtB15_12B199 [Puccinia triticina]|nr:hypothetical protein PtB15_12B199 [Puccinia triticina]